MKTISCVFAALCLISIVAGQIIGEIISEKKCADLGVPPMQNFQKDRVMGLWYVQEKTITSNTQNADCYTSFTEGVGNTAVGTDIYQELDLKLKSHYAGLAIYDSTGKAVYSCISTDNSGFNETVTVLSTDYDNYIVEWSCADKADHSESKIFVGSRSRSVPSTIQAKIDKVLADNNIDKTKMMRFKQDVNTCVYGSSGGLLGGLLGALLKLVGGLLG